MSLHQTHPAFVRRVSGRFLIAFLVGAGGYSALAARADTAAAPSAKVYNVAMKLQVGSHTSTPRLHVKEAEAFKVTMDNNGAKMTASLVVTAAQRGAVKIAGTVDCAGTGIAHPVLITRLGESAAVKMQEGGGPQCALDFVVVELKPAAAG